MRPTDQWVDMNIVSTGEFLSELVCLESQHPGFIHTLAGYLPDGLDVETAVMSAAIPGVLPTVVGSGTRRISIMGSWTITIEGVGSHHNADYPKDANIMARQFTAELTSAGHVVERSTFTYGGRDVFPSNMTTGLDMSKVERVTDGVSVTEATGRKIFISDQQLVALGAFIPQPSELPSAEGRAKTKTTPPPLAAPRTTTR